MRGERADSDHVIDALNILELVQPADVDQMLRLDDPQVEHGDEALASCEQLCLLAVPVERREYLFDCAGTLIFKTCRFHEFCSSRSRSGRLSARARYLSFSSTSNPPPRAGAGRRLVGLPGSCGRSSGGGYLTCRASVAWFGSLTGE